MRILLTAFADTAADMLVQALFDTLPHDLFAFLTVPYQREASVQALIKSVLREKGKLRYVVLFGQKAQIGDRVHVEICGRARDRWFETDFPVARFMLCAAGCGLPVYLSQNAGAAFPNHLYAEGLRFFAENPAYRCRMVLCHIPCAEHITHPTEFADKCARTLKCFAEQMIT